jgi:hypothetical protein
MHLIHFADTHLGLAAFNRLDPRSGMNLREKQVYDNFLLVNRLDPGDRANPQSNGCRPGEEARPPHHF